MPGGREEDGARRSAGRPPGRAPPPAGPAQEAPGPLGPLPVSQREPPPGRRPLQLDQPELRRENAEGGERKGRPGREGSGATPRRGCPTPTRRFSRRPPGPPGRRRQQRLPPPAASPPTLPPSGQWLRAQRETKGPRRDSPSAHAKRSPRRASPHLPPLRAHRSAHAPPRHPSPASPCD